MKFAVNDSAAVPAANMLNSNNNMKIYKVHKASMYN